MEQKVRKYYERVLWNSEMAKGVENKALVDIQVPNVVCGVSTGIAGWYRSCCIDANPLLIFCVFFFGERGGK